MFNQASRWLAAALIALFMSAAAFADTKTIEEYTEDDKFEQIDGLFPLYRNTENGDLFMEISADLLGQEIIYFTYTENGAPRVGHFRGQFRANRILTFAHRFGKIEIEAQNTNFSMDPDNALSRAAEANITRALLAVVDVVALTPAGEAAEGEDGAEDGEAAAPARYLINAGRLLQSEDMHQIKPIPPTGPAAATMFQLGRLDSGRTRILDARSYPLNTDVVVEYVFFNDTPRGATGPEITDPRSVAIQLQHSFIAMPEDGFEPRADDFRVGYFGQRVTNLTDTSMTPFDDVINRWRW